jgi:cell division protein FtsB
MRESASHPVIVRTYSRVRRALLIAAALLGAFALYIIYELGRYDGGYDRLAVAQQRAELEAAIEHLKKDNHELNLHLAELDTQRIGWAREQAEVSRTIGDLQAQVARQSQDLAFYRGVGAQSPASAALGISIQQLHIGATAEHAHVRVHLTLVRSVRADDLINGSAVLQVEGEAEGRQESLGLAALTVGAQRELRYSFRYYQNLEQDITIPDNLRPERLSVEVRSSRKGIVPVSQTFLWNVDAS